jgi:XapX domain-containing protein
MKTYLVSVALGVLVGGIYGFFSVRSPAPPVVALVGLLGMLIGEQLVLWTRARGFDVHAITHIADHTPKDRRTVLENMVLRRDLPKEPSP